jgi:hypothetical protein
VTIYAVASVYGNLLEHIALFPTIEAATTYAKSLQRQLGKGHDVTIRDRHIAV